MLFFYTIIRLNEIEWNGMEWKLNDDDDDDDDDDKFIHSFKNNTYPKTKTTSTCLFGSST